MAEHWEMAGVVEGSLGWWWGQRTEGDDCLACWHGVKEDGGSKITLEE